MLCVLRVLMGVAVELGTFTDASPFEFGVEEASLLCSLWSAEDSCICSSSSCEAVRDANSSVSVVYDVIPSVVVVCCGGPEAVVGSSV